MNARSHQRIESRETIEDEFDQPHSRRAGTHERKYEETIDRRIRNNEDLKPTYTAYKMDIEQSQRQTPRYM